MRERETRDAQDKRHYSTGTPDACLSVANEEILQYNQFMNELQSVPKFRNDFVSSRYVLRMSLWRHHIPWAVRPLQLYNYSRCAGLDWTGLEWRRRGPKKNPRVIREWSTGWPGLDCQYNIYICATCNSTLVIIIAHSCPHICCMNDDDDQLPSLQLQRNHWISGLMPANSLVCVETWQSILNFTQRSATDEWMNDDRATTHPQTYLVCAGEVWRW